MFASVKLQRPCSAQLTGTFSSLERSTSSDRLRILFCLAPTSSSPSSRNTRSPVPLTTSSSGTVPPSTSFTWKEPFAIASSRVMHGKGAASFLHRGYSVSCSKESGSPTETESRNSRTVCCSLMPMEKQGACHGGAAANPAKCRVFYMVLASEGRSAATAV